MIHIPFTVSTDTVESEGGHGRKKQATAAPPLSSEYINLCICLDYDKNFFPVSGDKPTLTELLELNIPFHVADNYELFGSFLLQDDTGHKVDIIKHDCRGAAENITTTILKKWLQGGGMSVTWDSLVEALNKCKASYLASQIDAATKRL